MHAPSRAYNRDDCLRDLGAAEGPHLILPQDIRFLVDYILYMQALQENGCRHCGHT